MIEDGDSIFLDASSTCFILAQELAYRQVRDLTIITNSPRIVLTLRDNPECKTISTGGTYLKQFDSLAGAPAEEYVETLSVKKCFFSVLGVSTHACTDSEQLEVTLKKLILSRAMIKILLADHSKFTRFATFKVIETADLDILITDWLTPADDMSLYKELGLEVIRAGLEDNKT
jgi:DeoR/GlpR family transcriptional regulator of sugar metabolism